MTRTAPISTPSDPFAESGHKGGNVGAFVRGDSRIYVKLFASILESSVWEESPSTRLVWITMLLLADEDGFVKGVPSGIARRAAVSPEECRGALEVLCAPDIQSQTQDYGGRRIEAVEGGWHVLNYTKYREFRTREQVKSAARQRRKYHADKQLPESGEAIAREGREVSRSSASPSVSASGASDAEKRFRVGHHNPAAFDSVVAGAVSRFSALVVAQAMQEMEGAGARFSGRTLIAFAAKVGAPSGNHAPAAAPPMPFCKFCGEGMGKLHPDDTRLVQLHKPGCANAD